MLKVGRPKRGGYSGFGRYWIRGAEGGAAIRDVSRDSGEKKYKIKTNTRSQVTEEIRYGNW